MKLSYNSDAEQFYFCVFNNLNLCSSLFKFTTCPIGCHFISLPITPLYMLYLFFYQMSLISTSNYEKNISINLSVAWKAFLSFEKEH